MTYQPPKHIAVVNRSRETDDRDVAVWVEAVRIQLERHVARAWGYPPPGVFMYGPDARFPGDTALVCAIVDDDGDDEAAGLHGIAGNIPYALVDVHQSGSPSRTLSHEAIECYGNQMLDQWIPGPRRLLYARELCDPVQARSYTIEVDMPGRAAGELFTAELSDFVYPPWFGWGTGQAAYMDGIGAWEIADGGYAIAADENDRIVFLPDRLGLLSLEPRKFRPATGSRTNIIARKGRR